MFFTNTLTLYIGNNSDNDVAIDGKLDDVRFFDRILTQTEIDGIYNGGSGTEEDSGII